MSTDETVVFVHGLGDGPDAWAHQIAALPHGVTGLAVEVPGLQASGANAEEFSLAGAATSIIARLDELEITKAHLCGLSLGAMISLRTALEYPERVRSLVLAAGQVKPPRALMAIQNAVMRVLPEKLVAPGGVSKAQMLAVVRAVTDTDFSDDLSSITAPTLVLCGSKDRANLPAARALASGIAGAELQIIPGAGHQSNSQAPGLFSEALNGFLVRQA